ncbi:RHS repeat protein [Actinosynnema mirum]|uniref:RHS repeat protein n=1 Tax=Actinosynnema mirum TaxID=40567 RepID=UPI00019ACA07|nr:RHS repeat protein [Actinosynnema mirum]
MWFDKKDDGSFAPAERLHVKLTRTPEGGHVVTFDSSGERWLFTGSGWLVSQSDRNGNALTVGYAPEGHVSSVTDSQTRATNFEHDAEERPVSITDPAGETYALAYDSSRRLTSLTKPGDVTTTYADNTVTDANGNLTAVAPPAPAGASSYTYDSLSRSTGVTDGNGVKLEYGYDRLDRVVSVKRGAEVLQANSYGVNGNLTGAQVPGVSRVLAYDAADRLTSLADAHGGTTGFGYDDADRRTSTDFPGGATQRTGYDDSGRQTSITVVNGGRELLAASYRFTRSDGGDTDRLQSKTVKGVTTDYGYDALGRLTSAGSGTCRLDNASNLLSGEGRGYVVDAADQYTRINDMAVSFDGAGNCKSTSSPATSFTHSPANQVRTGDHEGARVMEFAYDTADQTRPNRITETPTGGSPVTHVFTRTALGVSEVVDNGVRSGFTRDTKGLLVGVKDGSGARHGAVTDYQGSVLALVDGAG